jgi:serine/threonine-protein kinase
MLCRALGAVHRAGLLHRDLTARNVMREATGRVVLMDFGTSRRAEAATADSPADMSGTPLYMAPEVLDGNTASVASDIYSLGVLLYYLLTTTFPVTGRTLSAVHEAHRRKRRRPLRPARPQLQAALVRAIERALTPDPAARFPSADAMGAALARSVGKHQARQGSARPRRLRMGRRGREPRRPLVVGRDRERSALQAA